MAGPWPPAFFGFQQSDAFTIDARVLLLLGVSEHFQALLVDGGRKDRPRHVVVVVVVVGGLWCKDLDTCPGRSSPPLLNHDLRA